MKKHRYFLVDLVPESSLYPKPILRDQLVKVPWNMQARYLTKAKLKPGYYVDALRVRNASNPKRDPALVRAKADFEYAPEWFDSSASVTYGVKIHALGGGPGSLETAQESLMPLAMSTHYTKNSIRPSRDTIGMRVAQTYALLSTCPRRRVGCLLVDVKGRPLSVGYNGVASGQPHCIDNPCPGAGFPSGQGLDQCQALHAEQNAILQLKEPDGVETAYVTTFPCTSCLKLLMGTSCKVIVYQEPYTGQEAGEKLWLSDPARTIRRATSSSVGEWTGSGID